MSRVDYLERLGSGAYTAMGEDTRMNITSWNNTADLWELFFLAKQMLSPSNITMETWGLARVRAVLRPQLLEQFGLLSRPLA